MTSSSAVKQEVMHLAIEGELVLVAVRFASRVDILTATNCNVTFVLSKRRQWIGKKEQ
jgi:hypothetical protein